jgi:hypothetical protein
MNNSESVFDFYKLKKVVNPEKLDWSKIVRSTNTNAIYFIEKHIELLKGDYILEYLSNNPFAAEILSRHPEKIVWNHFVKNPNAIHIIDKYFDLCFQSLNKCGKQELLKHPNFVHLIKKYQQKIVDELLFIDCIPDILEIKKPEYFDLFEKYLEKYPEKIEIIQEIQSYAFWRELCQNPYAIHIIEKNLHKIPDHGWAALVKNENAIHLIEKNLDKLNYIGLNSLYQRSYVCWERLSENPAAISFLKKNIDKIRWEHLIKNPNAIQIYEDHPEQMRNHLSYIDFENISVNSPIFEIDYDAIEKRCHIYKEELMQVALHPSRIEYYLSQGISVEELDNYI